MNWREFQESTAEIFRAAGCAAVVEKTLIGVRGEHRIDVYVTFKKNGIDCSWVVECKCWNTKVPKEKVAALQSIVSDVGADRGVIVSEKGFQSGALRFSELSNITLVSVGELKALLSDESDKIRLEIIRERLSRCKFTCHSLIQTRKSESGNVGWISSDARNIELLSLLGKLSSIDMLLEKALLGDEVYPCGFNEESQKTLVTRSRQKFFSFADSYLAEVDLFFTELKGRG
ncbi:restriction endonuclease [Pseudomonas sp. NY15437]|uniref:restriction endonuclease n=1 Tax=Pseudomonas sp. NY15437 TaxID=3400360 RepID=UPI003A8B51B1